MFDEEAFETSLSERGYVLTGRLLDEDACASMRAAYDEPMFRKTVVMERHAFGVGEYKYFDRPLPAIVQRLRETAYAPLARVANVWMERLTSPVRYPASHGEFIEQCARAGQTRPTPLLLRYETGGYNCLHQDLYGDVAFPLQLVIMLSEPERDYDGGEFALVEQRPRAQSKLNVMRPRLGEGVVFATGERPVSGRKGYFRVKMRHGVSEVTHGLRYALGIIFHDAAG